MKGEIRVNYASWWSTRLAFAGCILFLYVPIVLLVIFSFNDSRRNIVWRGFTTHYYAVLMQDSNMLLAAANSLIVGACATLLSAIIGLLAAYLLWNFTFPLRKKIEALLGLPIVLPEICIGVSTLAFFVKVHLIGTMPWPFSLLPIIGAHTAFCFPFVTFLVLARLSDFEEEWREAARDLGANGKQVFFDIIFPFVLPSLVLGMLLAFTLSLDDFLVTFFLSDPTSATLPIKIYSMLRFSVSPELNAVSTLLLLLTIIITYFAIKLQNKSEARQKED